MTPKLSASPQAPICLTLPYPPSQNQLSRAVVIHGRMRWLKSEQARQFTAAVEKLVSLRDIKPLSGDVCLTLNVYRPRRTGDLDNSIKATQDALNGHAYADDKQITRIVANRFEDKTNPRVEVTIAPISEVSK